MDCHRICLCNFWKHIAKSFLRMSRKVCDWQTWDVNNARTCTIDLRPCLSLLFIDFKGLWHDACSQSKSWNLSKVNSGTTSHLMIQTEDVRLLGRILKLMLKTFSGKPNLARSFEVLFPKILCLW